MELCSVLAAGLLDLALVPGRYPVLPQVPPGARFDPSSAPAAEPEMRRPR